MKKTFLFLSLISLISFMGKAQTKSVNVDNFGFIYSYRGVPSKPLDPVRFNYAVKVNAATVVKNNVTVEDVESAVNIQGQAKVEKLPDASVIVELTLGNIVVSSSEVIERKEESKDKAGNITRKYYYKVIANYTFESSYRITNDQKPIAGNAIYSRTSSQSYQTQEYGTRKEASDFWNNNREVLIADFYRNLVFESARMVSIQASNLFGFPARTNNRDLLKTMNEKKHDENITFREAINTVKTELQAMTPDVPLNRERLTDIIEYLKSLPGKYSDPNSKADQRMRYLAYYNLGKIYYYLDEPENVKQYADLIAPNGYDEKDGAKLNKDAEELMDLFNKTNIRTRHFSPDEYFAKE
ncbi:MAG: hypothetical protein FWD60_12340 [Candidatus Azobacteroides sp.]|nr:hypothetical protein [Candidatus Azobacteroides sp.]